LKKHIKSIIALTLAIITTIGTPIQLFANPQTPVGVNTPGGILNNTVPTTPLHGNYQFNLFWNWDVTFADPTQTPGLATPPGPGPHQPEGADIEWRNASQGEAFLTTGPVRSQRNVPVLAGSWSFNGPLPSGSIIAFRTVPWHWHHFPPPPPPAQPIPPPPQLMRPADGDMTQVLYMTDLNITLEPGDMGGILITWDNPLFDNQQVFSGYQIEFRPSGGNWQTGTTVTPTTVGLETLTAGSQWRFELVHQSLRPGTPYDVRITPLIAGESIALRPSVQIGATLFNIAFSGRDFIEEGFYLRPGLSIRPEGQEWITLTWGMPDPALTRVTTVRIWSMTEEPDEDFEPTTQNATLEHSIVAGPIPPDAGPGVVASNHLLARPEQSPTWFMVEIIGNTLPGPGTEFRMFTNAVEFNLIFNDFDPYAPTIRNISSPDAPPLHLEITWRAFTRAWFREEDDHLQSFQGIGGRMVVDSDIVFYVYITDDMQNLDGNLPYAERILGQNLVAAEMDAESITGIPGEREWFYTDTFTHYVNAAGQRLPLQDNRIYYIRIVAYRTAATEANRSQASYGSHFIPPLGPLDLIPQMVPVRVLEVDGVRQITDNSIAIQWNLEWFEIYDAETDSWHDTIARDAQNNLVYGRRAANLDGAVRLWDLENFPILLSTTDVALRVAATLGIEGQGLAGVVVRRMRVVPSHYEIHVVEYEIMSETVNTIGDPYDAYAELINTRDGALWTNIGQGTESANENFREFEVTQSHNTMGAMQPNTSYVIFFRPVNVLANERYPAHYPTFTTGTTITQRPPLDIDPTVPLLEVVREETTDTSITLRWNGTMEFNYELFFSELLTDYPDTPTGASGGNPIPMELIREEGRVQNGFIYFTVDGLFPSTLYHFWIRTVNEQGRTSVWSNPVSEQTLDITPPEPPRAVARASNTSLQTYNAENNTEISHDEPDQLILEWMRIFADLNNPEPGPPQDGATVTNGTASWLDALGITSTYMVMIEELMPARPYYVRIQTILTVTRGDGPRGIVRAYSYRMHIADNPDFLDFIEIIVPSIDPMPDAPNQMRRAESVWAGPFVFWTDTTDEEYDGVDPEVFPVPDRDWELIFDPDTNTLTFRFRSNQIDQTGARDQNADQRFISRLVQQRVFTYSLDMSTYNNIPVANAIVEMPFSILNAFDERDIALELTIDDVRVRFTPGALNTAEMRAISDMGADTAARLSVFSDTAVQPSAATTFASTPRRISAELSTPTRRLNFENFAIPIQLSFSPAGQALFMEQHLGLYTNTIWTNGWERLPATHSPITGEMVFNANAAGSFAVLAREAAPTPQPLHPSHDAFLRVNSSIAMPDMFIFDPNENVGNTVFNNLVLAVANDRHQVNIRSPLSAADTQSLTRAGLLLTGNPVSRESAMAALVTLYERRTGRTVRPSAQLPIADLALVNPANQLAITKAAELGFFNVNARPNEVLTMGDLMMMLDVLVLDIR